MSLRLRDSRCGPAGTRETWFYFCLQMFDPYQTSLFLGGGSVRSCISKLGDKKPGNKLQMLLKTNQCSPLPRTGAGETQVLASKVEPALLLCSRTVVQFLFPLLCPSSITLSLVYKNAIIGPVR